MSKTNLITLLDGVELWSDLESRIAALPTEMERGEAFEEFCQPFFILDPVFQFKEVYRQREIPHSIKERLGYKGNQDIGIDGLCVTFDDKLFAYQAKFRSDRSNTPTLRELSTFFTVSDRADWRITITNANALPTAINDRTKQSRVLSDRFDQLEPSFFKQLRQYLTEQIVRQEKKGPHRTQQEAIDAAVTYFKNNDRGQLILPCGTGKTLASMWIAEKLGCTRILIMLPSLFLMSQTLREWAANSSISPFRYICLCSDTTVDLGNDSPIEHLYEMDVPVTTDFKAISEFLSNDKSSTSIVFSTYQSSKVLAEAVKQTGHEFDVAIFDEAHRTTGTNVGVWNLALHNRNVIAKKRIFMTATPRIYAPHIVKKAQDDDILICSMDDESIYGKPFYEMTFGDAIERGHITDYRVIVIFITDSEVSSLIQANGRVITDDDHEWDAKAFAKRVALAKGMNEYNLKKVFTFHGKVNSAKAFTNTGTPYGINKAFEMLEDNKIPQNSIKYFHVNGTMPSGTRKGMMKEFKDAEIGIMSNARCLTEGVDVPVVDTVAFMDPKKSLVDIVQATGRAMRYDKWKEKGYIFIPVILEEDVNPENAFESSDFKTVWEVLQAIADQDQRLESLISNLRVLQGKKEEETQKWADAMGEFAERVEFLNIPKRIDKSRFLKALHTKTLEVIGKKWDFWFGLTLQYKEEQGNPNAPLRYTTSDGFNIGTWQGTQRVNYIHNRLSADKVKRLDKIGFIWNFIESAFEGGFEETVKYKEQFGTAYAAATYTTPEGFRLGAWQSNQRLKYNKNRLSPDKIKRLEEIGFTWSILKDVFERGFKETLKYKEKFGVPNATNKYTTPDGFNLGLWQGNIRIKYKTNNLSPDKIKRFEEIGFTWSILEEDFEKGLEETLKYKEQFGTPNATFRYVTADGFNLGLWQGHRRRQYKDNKLPPTRIKRLEDIGFIWDPRDEAFEKGFLETLKYKEQFGTPNAPHLYTTPDGLKLGIWQSTQRENYKKNRLSPERGKRLEEIGFIWNPLEDAFEDGFQEILKYKEKHGNPNAPRRFTTPDGFNIGTWVSNQRKNYKEKKLLPERIKRLEEIGFKWNPHDEAFENGVQSTIEYKKKYGTPNARNAYIDSNGFKLGGWQRNILNAYSKNKLSPDRINSLEEIGFIWNPLNQVSEEAFEKGFEQTVKYKDQYGTPNALQKHKMPNGFSLGIWQDTQRGNYKKNRLSPERVKRLEEIGFKWKIKKKE